MKIKAFTLTELLIALAVIGLLIAILLPVIFNLMPDQNALMAKRAYYAVQSIVADMINDEACYPNKTQEAAGEVRVGFDDGYGYADCSKWGGQQNEEYIDKEDANSKFLTLFVNKLDLKVDSTGSTTDKNIILDEDSSEIEFETKDGILWKAQNLDLLYTKTNPSIDLFIDTNGADKPNCSKNTDTGCTNKKDFDRFTIRIHADGTLDILEDWALDAVGINHDITGSDK